VFKVVCFDNGGIKVWEGIQRLGMGVVVKVVSQDDRVDDVLKRIQMF
jgi:DNA-binding transcriptional regulator of glucitol operon